MAAQPEWSVTMALNLSYYGTLEEANQYFALRLHSIAWDMAEPRDKPKALYAATKIIDSLNFKGHRSTVWALLQTFVREYSNDNDPFLDTYLCRLREDQIRAAEEQQPLEFPRGSDTAVPDDIRRACYEIAYNLLDGKDPEMELENTKSLPTDTGSSGLTTNGRWCHKSISSTEFPV